MGRAEEEIAVGASVDGVAATRRQYELRSKPTLNGRPVVLLD